MSTGTHWANKLARAALKQAFPRYGALGIISKRDHASALGVAPYPQVPSFTVTKLLWLKRHEPHVFDATRTVLLPHDYVNLWLTGRAAMEVRLS